MSAERFSLDTNVLVYAVDRAEPVKQSLAANLILRAARCDCVLTLQALSEFFSAVTRKQKMARDAAAAQVEDWLQIFPTLAVTPATLRAALHHVRAGRAAYWDALLVETAAEGGCAVLLSEDMTDGAVMGGLTIRKPFDSAGLSAEALRLMA
jgi:predicted nucleic acid-binding protein